MSETWPRATAFMIGLVVALAPVGCGGDGPSPIRLSVELSDDSFCPGGVIRGTAKPETIEVRLGLRSRDRGAVELTRQAIDLKVYRNDDPTRVVERRRIHVSMTIGETWRRPLDPIRVSPPEEEGRYVMEVSTEDGAWSSTPLEIWYDAEACPKPGGPPGPTPPEPPEAAAETAKPRRTALEAALEARWRCNAERGVEDLEVRVQVRNPVSAGRAERGFRPRIVGVDELDAFEQVAGSLRRATSPPGGRSSSRPSAGSRPGSARSPSTSPASHPRWRLGS